jgi:hypothetical protein
MTRSIRPGAGCCVLSALFAIALAGCGSGSAIGSGGVVDSSGVARAGGTSASGGTTGTGGSVTGTGWKATAVYPWPSSNCVDPTLGFTCVAPVCVADSGYVYCLGASGAAASYFAALSANGLGEWVATTPYPAPPVNNPACVASQGYVYCVGQVYNGPNWYDYVQGVYFAPLSSSGIGAWTQTTALPRENFGGTCVASSGYLYCIYDQSNAYFAPISSNGIGAWTETVGPPEASAGCFGAGDLVYCVSAGSSAAGAGSSAFQEGPSYFAPMSDGGLGSWTATTALPTPIFSNFAVAGTKVYYLAVPTLVAALSPSGISSWTPTFNPPGSWWASTCFAYENYLFCVTPGSDETYFVDIGQLTASSVEPNDPPPFSNPDFLGPAWSGSGGCSVSANGQSAGAPCFGGGIDWAVIFDCAAEAATSAGCKTTVVSELDTSYNYDMTIWYPCSQAPGPDANCCFQPTIGYDTPLFGWCISTGSNSFIISNPSPPPP